MAISVKPPSFDKNDIPGTVQKICDYQIQLQEQLDFQLEQMNKTLSALVKALGGQ